MDFELNEQQQEIRRVARDLLAERQPLSKVRAAAHANRYDDDLYRELVALGWVGIALPEAVGGQGLGMVELAVLLEEVGRACAAVPFLGSSAVATELAGAGVAEELLADLLEGRRQGAFGPPTLLLEGGSVEAVETVDQTRRYATAQGGGRRPLEGTAPRLRIALAAELLGLCQRALELTVEYVKQRKQFDRPVGSFQAVAHRAAEMYRQTETLRSAVYYAAWAADAEEGLLAEAAALAAATAAGAGREVTAAAIQLHGGIGFTWEADLHWLYKRAQADCAVLGPAERYLGALGRYGLARLQAVG